MCLHKHPEYELVLVYSMAFSHVCIFGLKHIYSTKRENIDQQGYTLYI